MFNGIEQCCTVITGVMHFSAGDYKQNEIFISILAPRRPHLKFLNLPLNEMFVLTQDSLSEIYFF